MRSEEAIAACRTLNFSDMSLIGRKKRCEYKMNATSDPSVSVPCIVQPPPNQMRRAAASAPTVQGPLTEEPGGPLVTSASTGLVGPGHCSIVPEPDGRHHLFLHAWNTEGVSRRPHRLVLDLTGDRPAVVLP